MHALQDDPDFLEHYGFKHDPFAVGGPWFQFFKSGRKEILEQLIHFSRYSQLVLMVVGPRGAGKTVLRHALAATSKGSAVNVVASGTRHQDAAALMQLMAAALGLANAEIMTLLQAVEQQSLAGKEVHLLVDDAQLLDASAMQLLQRLAQGNGVARTKVFLFGAPSLPIRLQELAQQGQPLDYHQIELEPWGIEDSQAYLQQRLTAAGSGLEVFTDQELGRLLNEAGGWPGSINQLAREILIARLPSVAPVAAAGQASPKLELPYRPLAALLVLLVAMLGLWLWNGPSKQESPQLAVQQVTMQSSEPEPPVEESVQQGQRIALPLSMPEDSIAVQPPAELQQGLLIEPSPVTEVRLTDIQAPTAAVPVAAAPAAVVAQALQAAVQPAPAARPKEAAPAAPAKPAVQAQPKVQAVVAERQSALSGQAWYLSQAGNKLTLQVFATASESKARSFVQSNGKEFRYYRKQHQGQPLYVVTHGLYDSRDNAVAAEKRLSTNLRKNKPWPKSLGSIQQEIR